MRTTKVISYLIDAPASDGGGIAFVPHSSSRFTDATTSHMLLINDLSISLLS